MQIRKKLCRSILVHVLHDRRNTHTVQHIQIQLQVNSQNIMLHVTAHHSDVMRQAKLILAQFIGDQVFRTQRRRDEWMNERKSTCAWTCTVQISVKLSTEAVMGSEHVLRVCLGDARAGQRDNLSRVCRKRYKVYPQTQVSQEHLGCKFQQICIYIGRYVLQVHTLDVVGNTRQGHLCVCTASAQRTCHVVCQEVQRQSTRVECVLACKLHAIIATLRTLPGAYHAVYFDFCAYTVEDVALDTAVRRMQHHRHRLILDTMQLHRRRRQIHTHAACGGLVNIHETIDCNCFSRCFGIKHPVSAQHDNAIYSVLCALCGIHRLVFGMDHN